MSFLFEYDPAKSSRNLELHGLDFEEAQKLWNVPHVIIPARQVGSEDRQAIIGLLFGKLYVAVFTARASTIRMISCHRADRRLQKHYERMNHEKKKGEAH